MSDIKASLNIILPGSVMYSKQECFKQLKKAVKKDGKIVKKHGIPVQKLVWVPIPEMHDSFTLKLMDGKKLVPVEVHVRACKPAKEVINITEEAYQYMSANPPINYKGNAKSYLRQHFEQIAEDAGGILESYQIFN